jgi:hypothetical protein
MTTSGCGRHEMRAAVVTGERNFAVASAADPVSGPSVTCGVGLTRVSDAFAGLVASISDSKMLASLNG